uniref:LanC-like protein 1 n=1 Tax=Caligus clemensi TaxID=344056 RepID=C1C1A4_CALCM|nr:LanC-like protein 1 [Caligus clemensi]
MQSDKRYINNPYPDFDDPRSLQYLKENCAPPDAYGYMSLRPDSHLSFKIQEASRRLLNTLHQVYFINKGPNRKKDGSVYTGLTGILYVYQEIGIPWTEIDLYECIQSSNLSHFLGYICGISGPLAFGACFSNHKDRHLQSLIQLKLSPLFSDSPEEFLYGKAGYLYALLLVKKHNPDSRKIDETIKEVIAIIIHNGIQSSKSSKPSKLHYVWYNEEYLGAAHGYAGILSTLLRAKAYLNPSQLTIIRDKINELAQIQMPSGNFPPSMESLDDDRFVHWCHGAPGFADLYLLAYEVFQVSKYLQIADRCLDVIWQRGLLKKGFGLCHGSSGNGYAFLLAYKSTKDPKHLYRALRFADWCSQLENSHCKTPDNPYSLFEGQAGNASFLHHIQANIQNAYFPCYTL